MSSSLVNLMEVPFEGDGIRNISHVREGDLEN